MNGQIALLLILLASHPVAAIASETTYRASRQSASAQYAEDRKLCADESSSSVRMQCLRDAKAEYNKALAAANKPPPADSTSKSLVTKCPECGQVLGITKGTRAGEGGPLGMIGGGVAGALLGHQIGKGTGKDIATLAGAAGGAYAGRKVEEKMRATDFWSVKIQLESGEQRSVEFDHDPGFATGDQIRLSGGSIVRR